MTDDPGDDDVLVCGFYTAPQQPILPDNMLGECTDCGRGIQFRPFVAAVKRKVCIQCVINLVRPKKGE